jgi:nucleoside 2-deoxyribosyltransferase
MNFDQYIQYRALSLKASVDGENLNSEAADRMIEKTIKNSPDIKTVCTPIHIELFNRLEDTISPLNISKRAFIQMAIIEALDRADAIVAEVDVFENVSPPDADMLDRDYSPEQAA